MATSALRSNCQKAYAVSIRKSVRWAEICITYNQCNQVQSVVRQWFELNSSQPALLFASGIRKRVDKLDKCLNELGLPTRTVWSFSRKRGRSVHWCHVLRLIRNAACARSKQIKHQCLAFKELTLTCWIGLFVFPASVLFVTCDYDRLLVEKINNTQRPYLDCAR